MADNIKVAIKVRPLIKREKENLCTWQWTINGNTIVQNDGGTGSHDPFCFDHIYDEKTPTVELFNQVCKPIVENAMKGINGTLLAYGQTSSGKTYTMTGVNEEPGVTVLAIRQIFKEIEQTPNRSFLLRIAYIEIYNEKIFDLLDSNSTAEVKIRDTTTGDIRVSCKEVVVNSAEHIINYMLKGNSTRRMEETNMNERSSRSHTIFRVMIESRQVQANADEIEDDFPVIISTLNLVDLAGSERADQSGATGSRLKEGCYINKSLLSLGLVINKLSESQNNERYINYRDSKLTRILQSSIGGNSMTAIICTVTPAVIEETNYTLLFAMRAKKIKNKPTINEGVSEATATRRLLKEIKRLTTELDSERKMNNNLKILQLQKDITERKIQFIGSTRLGVNDKARRRTWCPTSVVEQLPDIHEEQESTYPSNIHNRLTVASSNYITLERGATSPVDFELPPEFNFLDLPECSTMELSLSEIKTPECMKRKPKIKDQNLIPIKIKDELLSPLQDIENKCTENCDRCKLLEKELEELQDFTRIEKRDGLFNDKIKEHNLYEELIKELNEKITQKDIQCDVISMRCSELEHKVLQFNEIEKTMSRLDSDLKQQSEELKVAIKERNDAQNELTCIEIRFESLKQKSSDREKELTEMLDEMRRSEQMTNERNEILEKTVKELEIIKFNNITSIGTEPVKLANVENLLTLERNKTSLLENELHENRMRWESTVAKKNEIADELNNVKQVLVQMETLITSLSIDGSNLKDKLNIVSQVFNSTNNLTVNENGDVTTTGGELSNGTSTITTSNSTDSKYNDEYLERLKSLCNIPNIVITDVDANATMVDEPSLASVHVQTESVDQQTPVQDKSKWAKLQIEYDELSIQLMEAIEENENYKTQLAKFDEPSLNDLRQDKKDLEIVVQSMGTKLEWTENEVERLQSELDNVNYNFEQFYEQIKMMEIMDAEKRLELYEKNENLKLKLECVRLAIEEMINDAVNKELEIARQQQNEIESRLQMLQDENVSLVHQLETTRLASDELKIKMIENQQLDEILAQLSEAQSKSDDFQLKYENTQSEMASLNQQLVDARNSCNDFNEKLQKSLSDHTTFETKFRELTRIHTEIETERDTLKLEIVELTENNSELKNKHSCMVEGCDRLKMELEKLTQQQKEFEEAMGTKLDWTENEVKRLQSELADVNYNFEQFYEQIKAMEIMDADKRLELYEKNENLKSKLECVRLAIEEMINDAVHKELEIARQQQIEIESRLTVLQDENASLVLQLETTRLASDDLKIKMIESQQLDEILAQLSESQSKSDDFKLKYENSQSEIVLLNQQLVDARNSCNDFNDKLKKSQSDHTELETKFTELIKIRTEVETERDTLKLETGKLAEKNSELEKNFDLLKNQHNSMMEERDHLKMELEKFNGELENKLTQQQNEFEERQKCNTSKINQLEMVNQNLEDLQKQLERKVCELENSLVQQLEKTRLVSDELRIKNNENQRLDDILAQLSEAQSKSDDFQLKYENSQSGMASLNKQLDDILAQLSESQSKSNDFQLKYENSQSEIVLLNQQLGDARNSCNDFNEKLQKSLSDHTAFETKITELTRIRTELEMERDTLKLETVKLTEKNSELKNQNSCMMEERDRLKIELKNFNGKLEDKLGQQQKEFEETQKCNTFKIKQLEMVNQNLADRQKQLERKLCELEAKRKSEEKNLMELKTKIVGENSRLLRTNTELNKELEKIQTARKSRRNDSYDNNRYDLFNQCDVGVMTDKTDTSCNCDLMDEKIKKLERDNKINECHVFKLQLDLKHHPLTVEHKKLQERLREQTKECYELDLETRELRQKLNVLSERPVVANKLTQTSSSGVGGTEKENALKSSNKNTENEMKRWRTNYEDVKRSYQTSLEKVRGLEKLCSEKDIESRAKLSATEMELNKIKTELISLQRDKKSLEFQLTTMSDNQKNGCGGKTKTITEENCQQTQTEINYDPSDPEEKNLILSNLNQEVRRLRFVYEKSKYLAIARGQRINSLEQELQAAVQGRAITTINKQ